MPETPSEIIFSKFKEQFLNNSTVGFCYVFFNAECEKPINDDNLSVDEQEKKDLYEKDLTRRKILAVEVFRKLNQAGTPLPTIELVASKLKALDPRMETFLDEMDSKYVHIGLDKEFIIKTSFILIDDPLKGIVDVDKSVVVFIISNMERIKESMVALMSFLELSNLANFYKSRARSRIPLYFIVYNIFHSGTETCNLRLYFDKKETDSNYLCIVSWIYLSLLNNVFLNRGAGWAANTTGIRKIHSVARKHKNKRFPTGEVFDIYKDRLHHFFALDEINETSIDRLLFQFIFYLLYLDDPSIRFTDYDHIHPKSKLEGIVAPEKINSVGNFQVLNASINRSKQGLEFFEWIEREIKNDPKNVDNILHPHLIPGERELWKIEKYEEFLAKRLKMLVDRLKQIIPSYT